MAVIKGHNGSLRDGSGDIVGELTSFTLSVTQNSEQHNAFGETYMNTTATNKSWAVEGSGMFDPDDTQQAAILDELVSGDAVYAIEVRPEGDSVGDDKYTGSVVIGEVSVEASSEGVVAFSFSSQGTGTLTKGTVS
tara:strand:+ start:4782 stop:5189 length:408 start_codon:yes stop_codon:yes gene_type:complete